jgi:hypothetical protein
MALMTARAYVDGDFRVDLQLGGPQRTRAAIS